MTGPQLADDELRDQFDRWAAPLRATAPPAVSALRRRARRRAGRFAAATGSAVAVAGVVAALLVAGHGATPTSRSVLAGPTAAPSQPSASPSERPPSNPWGSARYPAPPDQPYVLFNTATMSAEPEVLDMATGTVVGPIPQLSNTGRYVALAADASDRRFVLAWQDADGTTTFWSETMQGLPVTGSGGITTVAGVAGPLPISIPATNGVPAEITSMAVNSAGTRLVVQWLPDEPSENSVLVAFDLTTGAQLGSWQEAAGSAAYLEPYWPSADALAIAWPDGRPEVRILELTGSFPVGSSLLADTQPDPSIGAFSGATLTPYDGAVLTTDGSTVLHVTEIGAESYLQEYAAATGALLRTIPLGPTPAVGPMPEHICGVLWASADGSELLTQCGTRQQAVVDGSVTVVTLATGNFYVQMSATAADPFVW